MRNQHTLTVLLLLALSSTDTSAQRQYDLWYFGYGNGLTFSTNPPTVINGQVQTFEGSAVYCDPRTGELRLYTDGMTVWNRAHQIMPNGQGLISDQSSTQAALILPDPANTFRYYIFHSDHSGYGSGSPDGVHYSICDMELAGGLGDIVQKNIPLIPWATEKLTAVPVCNSTAYWVLTHEMFNNTFVAWYLDAQGLSDPVRTRIGHVHGMSTGAGAGYLVASPDGTMLASVVSVTGSVEIYRFDQMTGRPYDVVRLPNTVSPYGICFSPSNRKLYVSGSNKITQYDITSWDSATIAQSRVDWSSPFSFGQAIMQGPDGKLYLQHWQHIGVIRKPNEAGSACEYDPQAIPLPGAGSAFGLPNNISTTPTPLCRRPLARIGPHATNICEERCIDFYDSSRYNAEHFLWTFEGATPATSTDRNPKKICFSQEGTYTVKLVVWNESGRDSTTSTIVVKSCPIPDVVLRDTTICLSDCLTFRDTSSISTSTMWQFDGGKPESYTGKTPPQVCYYRVGRYLVRAISSNQYGADTAIAYVTVENCELPASDFTHNTLICIGDTLWITDKSRNNPTEWQWTFEGGTPASSTGKTPGGITYSEIGDFEIRLITSNNYGADTTYSTINVSKCEPPQATLHSYEICEGDCIYLEDSSTNFPTSWEWQLEGFTPGMYTTAKPGQICYDTPGRFGIRLISRNLYGVDTAYSTVLVRPATGYVKAMLNITNAIEACSWIDTSFMVYAGCRDNVFGLLTSSDPNIVLPSETVTIPANDSLRVTLRITAGAPGDYSTQITFSLNGEEMSIPCSYTVQPDEEQFTLSAAEVEFVTKHCDALTKELSITNMACAEQEISRIYLDASSGSTPFSVHYDATSLRLASEQSLRVTITYDPVVDGDINPVLTIETAKGATHRCPLRGVRMPLPELSLGLRSAMHDAIAGDRVGAELAFETAVGDTALPSVVNVTLDYNTDLLSIDEIAPQNGWSLYSQNEDRGTLTLTFDRQQTIPIALGELLAQLTFRTYLAQEDSTAVALSSVECDPHNTQFAECVLAAGYAGSGSVNVGALCGDEHIRRVLGKEQTITMTVRPNPVTGSTGKVNIDLTSQLANEAISYTIELIDVTGRSIELHSGRMAESSESLELLLPTEVQGLCVVRFRSDRETLTYPLIVR